MNNIDQNENNTTNNKSEYSETVRLYMEEKYSQSFTVIDYIIPDKLFSGTEQNIIILKDSDGIICNVRSNTSTPNIFYDDYNASCIAFLIKKDLNPQCFDFNKYSVYVTAKNAQDITNITSDNVKSLTLVGGIYHAPTDKDINELYDLYKEIEKKGYKSVFMIIGFVDNSEDFDRAIENYHVYGKSSWDSYNGLFYGYLTIKESGLSFDEFKSCVNKEF